MTQFNNVTELPLPDTNLIAHSHALVERIQDKINRQSGFIGFDEFMRMALYEPGLGYYSAGLRKFGEAGDFITAPEISNVFSKCLARQCEEVIRSLEHACILELGAGTGVMAADILSELHNRDALPEQYWILEVSADLKQRQQSLLQERLPFYFDKIVWLDQPPAESFNGIILGNEIIDALPVKRFIKQEGKLFELGVGWSGEQFEWQISEQNLIEFNNVKLIDTDIVAPLPDGYTSEINIALQGWLSSLADSLESGVMLFLDYGYPAKEYYHPEKIQGTLLCHFRHHAHGDPFYFPGLQDITASVDFTHLAECAHTAGLHVSGFTTQTAFLIASGLEKFALIDNVDNRKRTESAQAIRTLTMPAEMGERVKAIALTRQYDQPLLGFSFMDQRTRL